MRSRAAYMPLHRAVKTTPPSAFVIPVLLLLFSALPGLLMAQGGGDLHPELKTPSESLQRWRALRVGTFIHWSPWVQPEKHDLLNRFRAEKFDPKEWLALFQESGFKYVVFTTKHGDAVCMWDTKETTRNVMNTGLKRDVVGELVAECRSSGIEFCPYYAIENFLHPDWTSDLDPETGKPLYKARKRTQWTRRQIWTAALMVCRRTPRPITSGTCAISRRR